MRQLRGMFKKKLLNSRYMKAVISKLKKKDIATPGFVSPILSFLVF